MNKTTKALLLTVLTLIFIVIMLLIGVGIATLIVFYPVFGITSSIILLFVLLFLAYRFM